MTGGAHLVQNYANILQVAHPREETYWAHPVPSLSRKADSQSKPTSPRSTQTSKYHNLSTLTFWPSTLTPHVIEKVPE